MQMTIEKALKIARKGNIAKEADSFLGKRKRMLFLNMLRDGTITPDHGFKCRDGKVRKISHRRVKEILAVDAVEDFLLQQVERLLLARASRFLQQLDLFCNQGCNIDDILQELRIAVNRVVHMYDAEPTRLAYMKVLKPTIRNRLNRWASSQNLFQFPEHHEGIKEQYEQILSAQNGPCNFDEIVELMGVKGEQLKLLESALTKVLPVGCLPSDFEFDTPNANEEIERDEYTTKEMERAIKHLSPFEQILVEAFTKDGDTGWQKRVADTLYRVVETGRPKSVLKDTDPAFFDDEGEQHYGDQWLAMKEGVHESLYARPVTKQAISSAFKRALGKVKQEICVA